MPSVTERDREVFRRIADRFYANSKTLLLGASEEIITEEIANYRESLAHGAGAGEGE